MIDQPRTGLRVTSLNCRRSPEVVLSVLNTTDPQCCDILCLQELPAHIDNYASFRSPHWNLLLPSIAGAARDPLERIRSVIYVSNRLPSDSYTQMFVRSLDACAVHFTLFNSSFFVFSAYNPPGSVATVSLLRSVMSSPAVS